MTEQEFVDYCVERLAKEEGFRVHEEEFPEISDRVWRNNVQQLMLNKNKQFSDSNNAFSKLTEYHQWSYRLNRPGCDKTTALNAYKYKLINRAQLPDPVPECVKFMADITE